MLQLCGLSASNYYNKIKLQLLEKTVPFDEVLAWTGETDAVLAGASPLGKVPFLQTAQGPLCESIACAEYIEAAYPQPALLPSEAYAAAKVRELILFLELHLELVAREVYPQAFFGATLSDASKERTRKRLVKGIVGFSKLVKFSPYVAGAEFTLADCAAIAHLPLVSAASQAVYGEDLLAQLPVRDYLRRMGERATVRKVNAERKLGTEALLARIAAKSG
ncbi:MAG: glutathione S-transferase [Betaproteobacteria bacterium]